MVSHISDGNNEGRPLSKGGTAQASTKKRQTSMNAWILDYKFESGFCSGVLFSGFEIKLTVFTQTAS